MYKNENSFMLLKKDPKKLPAINKVLKAKRLKDSKLKQTIKQLID